MIAAGTNAPTPIAANAMPANQCGNKWPNSSGTASYGFFAAFTACTLVWSLRAT
jgi:hypothetical protein